MSIESYKGIIVDSLEEKWFCMWLDELVEAGYVESWEKCSTPISIIPSLDISYIKSTELKTKIKKETKTFSLLRSFSYTPDFCFTFTKKGFDKFASGITEGPINPKAQFFSFIPYGYIYVEIKPKFDFQGKTDRFSIVQKIIWDKLKLFVDLIVPEDLFKETFIPKEAIADFKYKKKPREGQWKCKYVPRTLKQFINEEY